MKKNSILIVTQRVDINDDVLGFMHGWINEFAKRCEKITVIALGVGKHDLPKNVRVLSLGKEDGVNRIKYLYRFYKYIWRERKCYDSVFVHMNREYMILGGLFWRLLNKKSVFWYNHNRGNIFSNIAGFFASKICYTSPYSFFARKKCDKAKKMPAGIDTKKFKKILETKKIKNSILYIGRISPVKNLLLLVKVANELHLKGIDFKLNIVGDPGDNDSKYFDEVKKDSQNLEKIGKIVFHGKVSNKKAPEIYNQNEIVINLTNSGSFDKTIFEAMACQCLSLVSNKSLQGDIDDIFIFKEKDSTSLLQHIISLFSLSFEEKKKHGENLEKKVVEKHSLTKLVDEFINDIQKE